MSDRKFADLGLIGLGTMGKNLALNVASNGFSIVGYDQDKDKVEELNQAGGHQQNLIGVPELNQFIQSIRAPRAILLLVPAGKIVDTVIADLVPHLEPDDIIIDGGNSHFQDTTRRQKSLQEQSISMLGLGISGGAEGARLGPSMMPGGNKESWLRVKDILEAVSAKYKGDPCVRYLGKGSVGHYVKMVHNGIEYAMMQSIAEIYDIMLRGMQLLPHQISEIFTAWNRGPLQSYLIEITAAIFQQEDPINEGYLIDKILDKSKAKGTGKWTSQDAMDIGSAAPNIDLSVAMRDLSSVKEQRLQAAALYQFNSGPFSGEHRISVDDLEKALYLAFIVTYAQGFAQLRKGSLEYGFDIQLQDVATIWRAGCIIRAQLLDRFREVYNHEDQLSNLLLAAPMAKLVQDSEVATRLVVSLAISGRIPVPVLSSTLAYLDAFRSADLPANLVQAQRDYFGAHTYERKDQAGIFTTEWESNKR